MGQEESSDALTYDSGSQDMTESLSEHIMSPHVIYTVKSLKIFLEQLTDSPIEIFLIQWLHLAIIKRRADFFHVVMVENVK